MKLTTKKAMMLLKEAGIELKYTTFMKWVREGKVKASMNNTKEGYRIEASEVEKLIKKLKEEKEDVQNPFEDIKNLKKENEELRHKLNLPNSYLKAENLKLQKRIRELEEEVIRTREDQTIYVRVE